jgi:hypothetical protein
MTEEMTLEDLSKRAARAGLKLAEDELQKLLPGINRALRQAAEMRQLIADGTEPASAFSALKVDRVSPP